MNLKKSNSQFMIGLAWVIVSVFYAYQYILRVMPNIMINDIMTQFNIDAGAFGQFSGVYYIGYALMHLPLGIFLDRYGPRKIVTGCIFLTVIGILPLIFSHQWIYPIFGRFLIGLGSSAAILGVFKILRLAFSEKRFPRMLSFSVMIGLLGAIYGGGPVDYLRAHFGYQVVLQVLAIVGFVLGIITYWIIPEVKAVPSQKITRDIKDVLTHKQFLCACFFAGLMVGPLEGFADVWGSTFLKRLYDFDETFAASLTSMIFIGMCFGAPVLSWFADKIGSYLLTIIATAFGMAISFVCLLTGHISVQLLSVLFVFIGVCCAYQILAIYKASSYVRADVAGLATAVANMVIMIFGYAFHTAIGTIIDRLGGINNSFALICGISVIPVALTLGGLGFFYLLISEKRLV